MEVASLADVFAILKSNAECVQKIVAMNQRMFQMLDTQSSYNDVPQPTEKKDTESDNVEPPQKRAKAAKATRIVPILSKRCMAIYPGSTRYCVRARNNGEKYCAVHKHAFKIRPDAIERQVKLYEEHHEEFDANAEKEAGWIVLAGTSVPIPPNNNNDHEYNAAAALMIIGNADSE